MANDSVEASVYQAMQQNITDPFVGSSSRLILRLDLGQAITPRKLSALMLSMAPGLKQLGWAVDLKPYGAGQQWVLVPPGWAERKAALDAQREAEAAQRHEASLASAPPWVQERQ